MAIGYKNSFHSVPTVLRSTKGSLYGGPYCIAASPVEFLYIYKACFSFCFGFTDTAHFSAAPNENGSNTGVDMRAFARPCSPRTPAEIVATLVWIEAVHLIAQLVAWMAVERLGH